MITFDDDQDLWESGELFPVPRGRGRWRFTLHRRAYVPGVPHASSFVAEVVDARSRRVERKLNGGATLTFSLDGASQTAALIREMQHDIVAWRWDGWRGADVIAFRGILTQSQDTLSEQADTVNFTAHDYLAMMGRRLLVAPLSYLRQDQDTIVTGLIQAGKAVPGFPNGCYLPLVVTLVNPGGGTRSPSGVWRDRNYEVGQKLDEAIANLAACENGFDFDVHPTATDDELRIFYPYQGELRRDVILEYGSTVSALSRSFNSVDYANYWQVLGSTVEGGPPLLAVDANPDANDVTFGLWQSIDNASDVSQIGTLQDKARADLLVSGMAIPSYSLELRRGFYREGRPNMGDSVRLIIRKGRLAIDDPDVRVVGLTFDIGEDGEETVSMEVGRSNLRFPDLIKRLNRDVAALARSPGPPAYVQGPPTDNDPWPRGWLAEAKGPASQTNYSGNNPDKNVVTLSAPIIAGRRYRYTLDAEGTIVGGNTDVVHFRYNTTPATTAGTDDVITSISVHASDNPYVVGTAVGFVPPQPANTTLTIRLNVGLYQVAGTSPYCQVNANECRIVLEDIGA